MTTFPPLQLHLLQAPVLRAPGQAPVDLPPNDALLLAWLALDGEQTRAQLAAVLWPQASAAGARANLRQRIKRLQTQGEQRLLVSDSERLSLAPDVVTDLAEMPAALQADAQAAIGPLLGPLTWPDQPAASAWVDQARSRVHQQRLNLLEARADQLEAEQQLVPALAYAQRLVTEAPLLESAHRRLMRLHYRRGESAQALAVYEQLQRRLAEDSGHAPDASTRALLRLIQTPGTAPAVPLAVSPQHEALHLALQRPPRLLQRDAELLALQQAVQHGGVVLLLGEAGAGKTRLLEAVEGNCGPVLRLRGQPGDPALPYSLLARWAQTLGSALPPPRQQALPGWARTALAPLWPDLAAPAASTLGEAPTATIDPLRLRQALALLVPPQAHLVLDDLHLADAASLALLPALLDDFHSAWLAARAHALPPGLVERWLAGPRPTTAWSLAPWDAPTVQALLAELGAAPASTAAWTPALLQHTGGRPGWLLASLRACLPATASALPDAPPQPLPTPAALQHGLQHQVAHLPPSAQALLHLACLAGPWWDADLAAAALDLDLPTLATPWAALQAEGLVDHHGQAFGVVAAAVRQRLSEPLARDGHGRLARALQARRAPAAQQAPHWEAAGLWAEAAAQHVQAAGDAETQARRADQLQHWGRAAQAWRRAGQPDAAFQAAAEEAETTLGAGDVATGLQRCQALLQQASTPAQWALAHRLHALALTLAMQHSSALEAASTSLDLARQTGDTTRLAEALVLKAWAAVNLNQTAQAEACLAEEAQLPLRSDDWRLGISRHSLCSIVLFKLERLPEALSRNQTAQALALRPQARSQRMLLLNNSVAMHLRLGQMQACLDQARQALQLSEDLHEAQGMGGVTARLHVGIAATAVGAYSAAIDALETCLQHLASLGSPRVRDTVQNHLAWLWTLLGRADLAWPLLQADPAQHSVTVCLRRWTLQRELQRLCGVDRSPHHSVSEAELHTWMASADPGATTAARLTRLRHLPAEARLPQALALAEQLQAAVQPAPALTARLLALQAAAELGHTAEAAAWAPALQATLQHTQPAHLYGPEAAWLLRQGWLAAGRHHEAHQVLDQARQWVRSQHRHQVPPPFQDSFLRRNAVNQAVWGAWQASTTAPGRADAAADPLSPGG
ncbi:MAG: BTAD domain-containing putative transcriptional regulator [Rubrivivax sp.]